MNKDFADGTVIYIKVIEYAFVALMPFLLFLNLFSDKVFKAYPLFFAIRLAGIFLVPIDYGS